MPDPLAFDFERVLANVRKADTEDLLNRVTGFRAGMEPEAIAIIEKELYDRGVTAAHIAEHGEKLGPGITLADGTPVKCSFCRAAAVAEGWGWHWLFQKVPIFPRFLYYCREHSPRNVPNQGEGGRG